MNQESRPAICLCPNCLTPAEEPGPCQVCGHERVVCRPGAEDDECRKPLMTASGRIKTQAPKWWLMHTVGELAEWAGRHGKQSA
jgi:hypothetical protein